MKYLALCLFCKNETRYLKEWIDYHLLIGVEHFFIYDNLSDIPVSQSLRDYVERGLVTVELNMEIGIGKQTRAYAKCLRDHREDFFWLGFIDIDEFIVPRNGLRLPEFLKPYEHFGGLAIFWKCFGSNGHIATPQSVLSSFIRTGPDSFENDSELKSIVNTKFVIPAKPHNPHVFFYRPGFYAVDENERPVLRGFWRKRTSRTIQINHYIVKSFEEFGQKNSRGGGDSCSRRGFHFYDQVNAACNRIEDRTILDLVDCLSPERASRPHTDN